MKIYSDINAVPYLQKALKLITDKKTSDLIEKYITEVNAKADKINSKKIVCIDKTDKEINMVYAIFMKNVKYYTDKMYNKATKGCIQDSDEWHDKYYEMQDIIDGLDYDYGSLVDEKIILMRAINNRESYKNWASNYEPLEIQAIENIKQRVISKFYNLNKSIINKYL